MSSKNVWRIKVFERTNKGKPPSREYLQTWDFLKVFAVSFDVKITSLVVPNAQNKSTNTCNDKRMQSHMHTHVIWIHQTATVAVAHLWSQDWQLRVAEVCGFLGGAWSSSAVTPRWAGLQAPGCGFSFYRRPWGPVLFFACFTCKNLGSLVDCLGCESSASTILGTSPISSSRMGCRRGLMLGCYCCGHWYYDTNQYWPCSDGYINAEYASD